MSWFSRLFGSGAPTNESRSNWLSDDDDPMWSGASTSTASGARVTTNSAMHLSAVWACVRLLTNAVATLPVDIVVSVGGKRYVEYTKPSWLSEPDPLDPSISWQEHVGMVTTSLLLDGNAFVYAPNGIFDPSPLIVIDPRRVEVKMDGRTPAYEVRDDLGRVIVTASPLDMLHATWLRLPGENRGLSPIDAARQGIGLGLTAEEFGARFFGQGTTLSYGVEIAGPLTDGQREELRSNLRARHTGVKNAHSVSILTGGAKFVPGLGITNEQAQFLELRKFQVEDIARFYGVPPHMLGSQEAGASSYNSVEMRGIEFREYAVLPLVKKVETLYSRLVQPPATLTGATASLKFNLSGIARADLKSRYEAYNTAVGGPFMTADEARALEDLAPIDGGEGLAA